MTTPELSIVIPLYQEEDSIAPLLQEIERTLQGYCYELLLVDDGSSDRTFRRIEAACATYPHLIGIRLARNFGQTAAMNAGFDAAQGRYIVYMDGDLQTDPADIPAMLKQLKEEQLDLINGWRKERQDDGLTRNLPSRIANALIRRSLGI
ncbi:MAG: glycosyltransferase family 2 protein, partial [Mariprofundales bacterium]